MVSVMEKMDSVLQRVHSLSTKAKQSAPVISRQKSIMDESELHEIADDKSHAISSETSVERIITIKAKKRRKRFIAERRY